MRPSSVRVLRLLADGSFLRGIDRGERLLAKILALVLGVVTIVAAAQTSFHTLQETINPETRWVGDRLTLTLGHLLDILIALEVLQNITAYLRRGVVQIELVLATAITAVARKVIVLPPGSENKPTLLLSLGATAFFLSAAWWLVHHSVTHQDQTRTDSTRSCRDGDRFGSDDGGGVG